MMAYLAGGMKSGWQDTLIRLCPSVTFLDPRSHGLTEPAAYTAWDLDAIAKSDLVVACMEQDNPSLYGLSLEVGYAHGLVLPVWLVGDPGLLRRRYFGMVESVAAKRFVSLEGLAHALRGVA